MGEAEGDEMQAETRVMQTQTRNVGSHQQLEEARSKFYPRASGASTARPHRNARLLASGTVRTHFCCLKPTRLGNWSQQPQEN